MTPTEINAAVAERLGWKLDRSNGVWNLPDDGWLREEDIPDFHGSADAALLCVPAAEKDGWEGTATIKGGVWCVMFRRDMATISADAVTFHAAICESFLKLPIEPK